MSLQTPEKSPELTAPPAREAFRNFEQIALAERGSLSPVIAEGWSDPETLAVTIDHAAESANIPPQQLAAAIEAKDDVKKREAMEEQTDHTRGRIGLYPRTDIHEQRVALLAYTAAEELNAPEDLALVAGLVHDWGKNDVPWEVVSDPSPYGQQERDEMKEHADKSADRINKDKRLPSEVAKIVKFHHTPTPNAGELSPEELRVHHALMCADIFDASTFRNDRHVSSKPTEKKHVLSAFKEILEGDKTLAESIYNKLSETLIEDPTRINMNSAKDKKGDSHDIFSHLIASLL